VGDLTPEKARIKALKLRASIADGADPSADRRAAHNAITVAELCNEYIDANASRIKPSTLAMDKSRIERHVKPLLGKRAVASLTHADMERFLKDVMTGKTAPKEPPKGKVEEPAPVGARRRADRE
jgi:hypothetical protein